MAVALIRLTLPILGGLAGTACMGERDVRNNYGLEGMFLVALVNNNLYHIVVNFVLCYCKAIIIILLLCGLNLHTT